MWRFWTDTLAVLVNRNLAHLYEQSTIFYLIVGKGWTPH